VAAGPAFQPEERIRALPLRPQVTRYVVRNIAAPDWVTPYRPCAGARSRQIVRAHGVLAGLAVARAARDRRGIVWHAVC